MTKGAEPSVIGSEVLKVAPRRPALGRAVWITGLVLGCPAAISEALMATGTVSSPWLSVTLACAMSLLICELGGRRWERNRCSADVLFSDLLLWGWIRRRAMERRLADAARLFSPPEDGEQADLRVENPHALLRKLAADLEATDPHTHGHSVAWPDTRH